MSVKRVTDTDTVYVSLNALDVSSSQNKIINEVVVSTISTKN